MTRVMDDMGEGAARSVVMEPVTDVQRLFDMAAAHQLNGRLDEAVRLYRHLVAAGVSHPDLFCNLALALDGAGKLADALVTVRHCAQSFPDAIKARWLLSELLEKERRGVLVGIVRQSPEHVDAWQALLRSDPENPAVIQGLGEALWRLRRMDEAEPYARLNVQKRPDAVEAWVLLGSTLKRLGKFVEAEQCFRRAIHLKPEGAIAHWNLSLIRLLFEDYEEGWAEFEWRWQVDSLPTPRRNFDRPAWQGEPLTGRRILVYWEQGFGDTFQMLRYVRLLKERGAIVLFEAQANLARLLSGVPWIDHVAVYRQPLPEFDVHVPVMSLPRLLGVDLNPAAFSAPYLHADPRLTEEWKKRLAHCQGLRVGIVWAGNPDFDASQFRSPGLDRFAQLMDVEGVSFLSLQVGPGREAMGRAEGFPAPLQDIGGQIRDFADTAAVLANIDVLISSDTGIVHLAGAMGKLVWLAASYPADWRWLLDGEISPWYPTVRIFRQKGWRDDWNEPFNALKQALIDLVEQRKKMERPMTEGT